MRYFYIIYKILLRFWICIFYIYRIFIAYLYSYLYIYRFKSKLPFVEIAYVFFHEKLIDILKISLEFVEIEIFRGKSRHKLVSFCFKNFMNFFSAVSIYFAL